MARGRDSYRSFRIRFGDADDGVARTFEAHVTRIERVFGAMLERQVYLRSDKQHLRLLRGNEAHRPIVEWIIVHLDANRQRKYVSAVRGPKSLADEGLVLAWLFPKRVTTIDYDKWSAWYCAGYELHVPAYDESWPLVPSFHPNLTPGKARLDVGWDGDGRPGYSVPVFVE